MISAVKRHRHETFIQHRENHGRVLQVTRCFRENCLARRQRLRDSGGDLRRPRVVFINCKQNQKSRIGDALHRRENPLRAETPRAPRTPTRQPRE